MPPVTGKQDNLSHSHSNLHFVRQFRCFKKEERGALEKLLKLIYCAKNMLHPECNSKNWFYFNTSDCDITKIHYHIYDTFLQQKVCFARHILRSILLKVGHKGAVQKKS